MSRKLVLAALMCLPFTAQGAAPGGPDCGWGNMLFDGQSGLGSHWIAWLTNGSTGNQTFGMTSGTNGCSTDASLTYGGNNLFASVMDEFSEDVARGDGEALTAVAVSMGISAEDRPVFKSVMHDNFSVLFPSENVTAEQVMNSMISVMEQNEALAKYVS